MLWVVGHDAINAGRDQPAHRRRVVDGPYVDRKAAAMRLGAKRGVREIEPRRDRERVHRGRSLQQRGRSFLAEQRQAQTGLLCGDDL